MEIRLLLLTAKPEPEYKLLIHNRQKKTEKNTCRFNFVSIRPLADRVKHEKATEHEKKDTNKPKALADRVKQ